MLLTTAVMPLIIGGGRGKPPFSLRHFPLPLSLSLSQNPNMARTKTRRSSVAPRRNQAPSRSPNQPPTPNQTAAAKEGGDEELVALLASAITLSLRFLNSNDLVLSPSQSLSLSSLLRSSALSLSSLLPPTRGTQLPGLPSPSVPRPPPSPSSNPFPWFRRFLSSSSASPSDPRWLETFRMSKPSFYLLLQTLSPSLSSLPSPSPLPADVKLSAALLRLAHAAPFPFVARRLGLPSPSLAARAFYETLRAASDALPHLFELSSDAPRVAQGFGWMSLPSCHGALAYSRFPVSPGPRSVLAQFLVDSECRFLDVSAGWDGSMAPADVLARTKLYGAGSSVLGDGGGAEQLPRYFIGGSCCPLLPWLLTPYREPEAGRGSKEGVFNTVHARGMEMAARALRRLRGRWRLLRTEWREECVGALPYVVVVSCLLHNYLVKCSEPVLEEGEGEGEGSGGGAEAGFGAFEGEGDEEGERIRDVITTHLTKVIRK